MKLLSKLAVVALCASFIAPSFAQGTTAAKKPVAKTAATKSGKKMAKMGKMSKKTSKKTTKATKMSKKPAKKTM